MLAILISAILSLYIFISFGILAEKILKVKFQFTDRILVGLSVTNTLVSLVSLFLPITILVLFIFLSFCFVFLYFERKNLKLLTFGLIHKNIIVIITFPFLLSALVFSLNPPFAYDSGLYHIQSIKWIQEYSVVPGLANLHGRFGFNPNIFTIFALTSLKEIFKQEIFSVNFVIYSILVLHSINRIYKILKQEGFTNSFLLHSIVLFLILEQFMSLSSPTPDLISIVLPLYILTNLPKNENGIHSKLNLENYFSSIILSVYTISVKLSTIPLCILILLLIIRYKFDGKKLLIVISIIFLILLPWLIRNVILSGYLIYPFSAIDIFNFDWKVPLNAVVSEKLSITGWARNPGEGYKEAAQMKFWEWFPIWWNTISKLNRLFIVISFLSPIFIFIYSLFKKIKIDFQTFAILFTSWIGVIFWILLAPDIRFGKAFLGVSAISPLLYFNFKINFFPIKISKTSKQIILVFIFIIVSVFLINRRTYNRCKNFIRENSAFFVRPKKIEIPQNLEFKKIQMNDLEVFIPAEGDRCYDYEIPCMPYKNYSLILRGKTLQSGFKYIQN
ncbi:putative membrane protein [Leptospira interrogans serovar Grippotyphosa str. UI 12769]|uniref:LIC_10190 family membrane protein n=1 Tax=Leptospira interrogans TaxID=173 RepID=UPI000297FED8|nr:membrane protein [Leptospira interrogans]EKR47235.1 putative membrane protein [Leptospira interrogans serovar Grippotyphosa str. UI 08368]EMN83775.1 putative membrane protein [Leptospira interrogans serovar Grippotyphosa str. UI 12769]